MMFLNIRMRENTLPSHKIPKYRYTHFKLEKAQRTNMFEKDLFAIPVENLP